ncbi:MAG: DUF134 domain-containing protein [Clostridia bacterium]|nr:DUF134 domain-containing protein [Clostridia bacterium]
MARPKINRIICALPKYRSFIPAEQNGEVPTVVLTTDEYELIRLHDLEHLNQNQAADQMRVSRPTAAQLLASAHKKIADAIVNGKQIRIVDDHCCICPVGQQCELEKGETCPQKHRCCAACKDKFKPCH